MSHVLEIVTKNYTGCIEQKVEEEIGETQSGF